MTPGPSSIPIAASAPSVLVVDDDHLQRSLVGGFLASRGYTVHRAAGGAEALVALAEHPEVGMMVSDVRMPGMSGLELLKQARLDRPALPVLLVTGFADVRDAVHAMRDGALNYLEKPIDLDELAAVVRDILGPPTGSATGTAGAAGGKAAGLAADATGTADGDADGHGAGLPELPALPPEVVAVSPAMRDALREASLVAPFDSRVLITGESGTGKEVVADLIHRWSLRRDEIMIRVNCAAIPEKLLESELFGHQKGAFTGATETRVGRFEEASAGTIFLDEIAELPMAVQAKLLRVTQDGVFQRLGSNKDILTSARLIAATNRDLEVEVAAGRFREDLFYRLNVIEINLPPLRERKADILPLATHFAARFTGGKPRLSPSVVTLLAMYRWPGNVRELQNAMERAVLMARGGLILPEHQPRRIQEAVATMQHEDGSTGGDAATPGSGSAAANAGGRLQDVEDMVIVQTLKDHGYNRTETAKALGISRRALIYKLRRLEEAGHAINP